MRQTAAVYMARYRAKHPEKVAEVAARRAAKSKRVGPGRVAVHGLSESREYTTWRAMLRRVDDPNYKAYHRYGGRGITVCDRWRADFMNFYADMAPRPEGMTLDRIDSDGNYEPSNCRWATQKEQVRNRSHG